MVQISVDYTGDLQCRVIHQPSKTVIYTDAPADIQGKARSFSPTDLVAGALGSCIATTLGIYAFRKTWNLEGMRLEIDKEMLLDPDRRIWRLHVHVWMPLDLPIESRQACERIAADCPVHKSLHPGTEITVRFHWPSHKIG